MKNQQRFIVASGRSPRLSMVALAVAAALAAGGAQAQSSITDLGTLGGSSSSANGVSADGSVVVGDANPAGDAVYRAFRWTAGGGMASLGTLGGSYSYALGVSADGSVVVGEADQAGDAAYHAFRWTAGGGMVDLGTLGGAYSGANGVSADGSVVVGYAYLAGDMTWRAFRWTVGGGMVSLGTLGGAYSGAYGASADGSVVVGYAYLAGDAARHAFRWTAGGGMVSLGTLGGTFSTAYGVSADGSTVVGDAKLAGNAATHAFRWTAGGGMVSLGTLGGTNSTAYLASADGSVVVGQSKLVGDAVWRAFRWTAGTGMQSVEDWLRAAGVTVAADITSLARGTNSDGSVVVGTLANNRAFIARVSAVGSGLVTLADVQQSLGAAATGGGIALSAAGTVVNGAHSRPLSRRVGSGQKTVWLAGDWGRDDHGTRSGDMGLAEVGGGMNLGPAQLNVSLGQTWAQQNLDLQGRAKTDGTYLLAEALIPVAGKLWATVGGYGHAGKANLRRSYLNAGAQDASTGTPNVNTWNLRARLDWDNTWRVASADFSPYVDLTYGESKLAAYTETGGGFPARFDARTDKATELRLGMSAVKPLESGLRLLGTLEAAHRFENTGARTSGEVIGLFGFDQAGTANKKDWLRASAGVEGRLAEGMASLSLNVTTKGEAPNYWLAANWQKAF